jgi:plastocyanin
MKKFIGLFILILAFVAFSGCTQQVVPEPVTTTPPTIVPTTVPTVELTVIPTSIPTPVVTTLLPTTKRTESPTGKVVTVIQMKNNSFVPQVLTVLPHTGITWKNDDEVVHSLKMTSPEGGFISGEIIPGATWSYTFGSWEGKYEVTDTKYPDMKGAVIINNDVHL